jgi:hypothetical protein
MSIATLKKKSKVLHHSMSVNRPTFSINGGHRNQGYVGQDTRGRSLATSLMRGNTLRGNGGCCGTYRVLPHVVSAIQYQNDPTVMKSSSMGTDGMLMTKYRWVRRPYPYTSVKPDATLNSNTQELYIKNLQKNTLADYNSCNAPYMVNGVYKKSVPASTCSNPIFTKDTGTINDVNSKYTNCNISQPEVGNGEINSQGEYLLKLDGECGVLNVFNVANTNANNVPFGCG